MLKNIILLTRNNRLFITKNKYLFAKPEKAEKGEKPQKGGKKQQGGGGAVIFVPQVPHSQIIKQYLKPTQNMLSTEQIQIMNQKFTDLSQQQKKMLSGFADRILQLRTPSFLQFMKWGGLGTTDSLYVATREPTEQQFNHSIKFLRKQHD